MNRLFFQIALIAAAVFATTAQASSHTCGQGQRLPARRSRPTVASISTVRCEGTPQPLNSAYTVARPTPPHSAPCCAGTARHSRVERRHSQPSKIDFLAPAPASEIAYRGDSVFANRDIAAHGRFLTLELILAYMKRLKSGALEHKNVVV